MNMLHRINLVSIVALMVFSACSMLSPLQKSKLVSVFHLIETSKYNEAKGVVEELIADDEFAKWDRTWYARGLLAQTAYREGVRRNDRRMRELYPDQLYVAHESFEKALLLDKRGRREKQLLPKYILLANDLQAMGEQHFSAGRHEEAFKAFETALQISEQPFMDLPTDTNLLYNTALAAYESRNWELAAKHLKRLHQMEHSPNIAHLLYRAYLKKGDDGAAEKALKEGVAIYDDREDLVLLLADFYLARGQKQPALYTMDQAIAKEPDNAVYHNTKGLIYQKTGNYHEAILAYYDAFEHAPDDLLVLVNIATCYYNIGVEIEESSRVITNSRMVQSERARSVAAFDSAVTWLDKVYEQEPEDRQILQSIYQLYRSLRVIDKADSLEQRLN